MASKKTATTNTQETTEAQQKSFSESLAEMISKGLRTTDIFGRQTGQRQTNEATTGTSAQTGATTATGRTAGTVTGTTGTQQEVARQFSGFENLPPELQQAMLSSIQGLGGLANPTTPGAFPPGVSEAAIRPITERFQETVIPSIRQRAASAGQLYGPRTDVLEERAGRDYLREVGDVQARMTPAAQQLQQQGTIGAGETLRGLAGTIFGAPAARETITGATTSAEQRAAEESRVAEEQRTSQQTQQRTAQEQVVEDTMKQATETSMQEQINKTITEALMESLSQTTGSSTTTEKSKPGGAAVGMGLGRLLLGALPFLSGGGAAATPGVGWGSGQIGFGLD